MEKAIENEIFGSFFDSFFDSHRKERYEKRKEKIEKLKVFLQKNYPNIQAFDCRNTAYDDMETVYEDEGIWVDHAVVDRYIEIFGLTRDEFLDLIEIDEFGSPHLKTFKIEEKKDDSAK